MVGIGKAIKGLGLLGKRTKTQIWRAEAAAEARIKANKKALARFKARHPSTPVVNKKVEYKKGKNRSK